MKKLNVLLTLSQVELIVNATMIFWASIKPGTWNIPEHAGTFRNIPEHEKKNIFMKINK